VTVRLGWFTTARGAGSRGMYEAVSRAISDGELDADVACVFSNREPGEDETTDRFFDLVRSNGHPLITRSSVLYRRSVGGTLSRAGEPLPPWRTDFDALVAEDLAAYQFDAGMLAGYMLIFTPAFVEQHPILNLHPATPDGPIGTWQQVIRELITERADDSGVMLHLAVPEVDGGPVVAYCRYPLHTPQFEPHWDALPSDVTSLDRDAMQALPLFTAIREQGMRYESPLVVAALAEFGAGRLRIDGQTVVGADGELRSAVDLTESVQARLR
jgi:folate-dependent phosphoribosylglycinamide formyltransferase PurN